MRVLLDSCAILFHAEKTRLSDAAFDLIDAPQSEVHISAISAAELACLQANKRILLNEHWRTWLRRQIASNSWIVIPAALEIIEEAYLLPEPIHRDPADRILIASARLQDMTIVTTDRLILKYPHVKSLA